MYLPDWTLPFKEPRTEIRCIKGIYYKYEVRYQYNKDKKRTDKIQNSRPVVKLKSRFGSLE